jgi:hypothetical protein
MGLSRNSWERQNQAVPASPSEQQPAIRQQPVKQTTQELAEESRKIRRLQMVVNMVMQVIAQDSSLTVDEASEMVADTRKAALLMFPDKELAFDMIYWPRLQRLMRERYHMQ